MERNSWLGTFAIIVIFTILLTLMASFGLPRLYQLIVVGPYKEFRLEETSLLPRYRQLNDDLLASIPSPYGVKEEMHSQSSDSVTHGAVLLVEYSNANSDSVLVYYRGILQRNGWSKDEDLSSRDTYLFIKETSCFRIFVNPNVNRYIINVWHDYFKQSFHPKMPPGWVIQINEVGEAKFVTCPPE
jgi:hypothetical protein